MKPEEMLEFAKKHNFADNQRIMWVARMALVAPLPPNWKKQTDIYGNPLFVNSKYIHVQYELPIGPFMPLMVQTAVVNIPRVTPYLMRFYDKLFRAYNVSVPRLIRG